jgi:hypothetical protein
MSEISSAKRKPDYVAHAVRTRGGNLGPKFTRIGVAFNHKNGGIGVMYDDTPLSGQIVLVGPDAELPSAISYSPPTRRPDFDACMVREAGDKSYWTEVGAAYRQEGHVNVHLEVVPHGKLVLSVPKDRE